MKVTPSHIQALRDAIVPLDTATLRETYRNGQFPRAGLVKDLNRRYRWDLFYSAPVQTARVMLSTSDYNDSHIETALKQIIPNL